MAEKLWWELFEQYQRALGRFQDVLNHSTEEADYVLDATIQRFEFCYELCWKILKRILWEEEKIDAKSPKQVLKQAFQLEWIDEETVWLKMLEDRNLMAHTYRELDAQQVYQRLPSYLEKFKQLQATIEKQHPF